MYSTSKPQLWLLELQHILEKRLNFFYWQFCIFSKQIHRQFNPIANQDMPYLLFLFFSFAFRILSFFESNTASTPQTPPTQKSTRMLMTKVPLHLHQIVLLKYLTLMHIFHTFYNFLLDSSQYLTSLWSVNAHTECIILRISSTNRGNIHSVVFGISLASLQSIGYQRLCSRSS